MKQGTVGLIFFTIGGALGFIVANAMLKDRYEKLTQAEIDSVKAAFRKDHPLPKKEETRQASENERKAYSQYVNKLGYAEEKKPAQISKPEVISPDEFGDRDGYEEISLTYYADGTVTDDSDRPMDEDEIEETIGKDSLQHFGEYEEDSVFVRNDRLKVDYEILFDQRTYADILSEKPYLAK